MSEKEQPSYYAIIPANVRYDNDLKPNEKLLYGEITCLSQSTGKCFASNEYFANLYGTSKETVSRWVSNLSRKGYVNTQLIYKEGTKQIINRYIQINQEGIDKKINSPIDEKVKDNNTRDNNTSILKEDLIDYDFFFNSWNSFADKNNLKGIVKLSNSRKDKLRIRSKEVKDFKKVFIQCLKNADNSNFLLGVNNRGWTLEFDWLIENDNRYIKILEGGYNDR